MSESPSPRREILLALTNPVDGKDDEFRAWYWGEHIGEVLQLDGFVSAQRYRAAEPRGETVPHLYATIYEVEGSAAEARDRLFGGGVGMSDTIDLASVVFVPFVADDDESR